VSRVIDAALGSPPGRGAGQSGFARDPDGLSRKQCCSCTHVHSKAELRAVGNGGRATDDAARREIGDEQVGGAWSETTCFHSSAGLVLYRPVALGGMW
jgi:hypothetical protein